jgi:hypothetical protein
VSELVEAKLQLAHFAHLADDEKRKANDARTKLQQSERRIRELEAALAEAEEERQQPKGVLAMLRGRKKG